MASFRWLRKKIHLALLQEAAFCAAAPAEDKPHIVDIVAYGLGWTWSRLASRPPAGR
jgi:hypothetical protein